MNLRGKLLAVQRIPLVRSILFGFGVLLLALSPLVGALPGPGGLFVAAAGLALALKYSEWAKRRYVAFKRKHPKKGNWADWSMRRRSARRREERRKAREAEQLGLSTEAAAIAPGVSTSGIADSACGVDRVARPGQND